MRKNLCLRQLILAVLICLLACTCLAAGLAESGDAEEPEYWGIIGKRMNVHRKGNADSSVLGGIEKGTVVDVYSKGRNWTKIAYGNGTGYVQTKFIEMVQRKNPFDGPMPGTSNHVAVAYVQQNTSFLPPGFRYPVKVSAGTWLSVHNILDGKITFPYRRLTNDVVMSSQNMEIIPFVPWNVAQPGDLLYAFSTFFSTSANKEGNIGRLYNIDLASQRLTNIIVKPDEVFSFNAICGPYTPENGYQPAPILSGESSMGFGGGVCQVCSTIYNIVLRVPTVILDMNWHSQAGTSYLPSGFDATVSNTKDMQFKNILPYAIRIEFESLNGVMTAFFYRADS